MKKTQSGMGAIPLKKGVAFRVWAPNAKSVSVIGDFNEWNAESDPMTSECEGYWYAEIPTAKIGQEYRYHLDSPAGKLSKIDPYAREVTNSIGNGIIHDPEFNWTDDKFVRPSPDKMVIYEAHIGTFFDPSPEDDTPASLKDSARKLHHLKQIGVNAIELMPITEFAGERSWGYNPAHIFAVESSYGGQKALKQFVKRAHNEGIAVILDVVFNHFGPSDLDLWQFDGTAENEGGGIYFYNDDRSETPWGNTRPDYGRKEVREFIRDNALMWLEECHIDGLRFDGSVYIRRVDGPGDKDLPDGWSLLQWLNSEIQSRVPGVLTIAEDLQTSEWLTKSVEENGAGFGSQWDAKFVHPIRQSVIESNDADRSMAAVAEAIGFSYNGSAFQRVIYSESHDEVANGKARVPQEVNGKDAKGWHAQKRSTLAAALVLTSPGIPMLFQGQEFLQDKWFTDTEALNWDLSEKFRGIVLMYRDLIRMRLNGKGVTAGLCGGNVTTHHVNEELKLLAFHRWNEGGAGDDVVVVANFSQETREGYAIGFPKEGLWKLRFNSDSHDYSNVFKNFFSGDALATPAEKDGMPYQGMVHIAPYSVLIFSQDK